MQGSGYTDYGVHIKVILPSRLRVCLKHLCLYNFVMSAHNLRVGKNFKLHLT